MAENQQQQQTVDNAVKQAVQGQATNPQQMQRITIDQLLMNVLRDVRVLSLQIDTIFDMVCDNEEKQKQFRELFEKKTKAYAEKVKSAQFKQKIMAK